MGGEKGGMISETENANNGGHTMANNPQNFHDTAQAIIDQAFTALYTGSGPEAEARIFDCLAELSSLVDADQYGSPDQWDDDPDEVRVSMEQAFADAAEQHLAAEAEAEAQIVGDDLFI